MTQAGARSAQQARVDQRVWESTVGEKSRLCGCLRGEEEQA